MNDKIEEITPEQLADMSLKDKIKRADMLLDRVEEIFKLWFDTPGINARKYE